MVLDEKTTIQEQILNQVKEYINYDVAIKLKKSIEEVLSGYEIQAKKFSLANTTDVNTRVFAEFVSQKAGKLSNNTMRYYAKTMESLIEFINKPVTQITKKDIEYFLLYCRNVKGNSPTTLNNMLRNISAFYTWARIEEIVATNPAEKIDSFIEIKKPIDHLDAVEWEQLKTGCKNTRDRALIEFLRCTAARKGEVALLSVNSINWDNGEINLFAPKTSEYRVVYLDKIALSFLLEYINERGVKLTSSEPLFASLKLNADGTRSPLGGDGLYMAVRNIGKQAKMERSIYLHLFRKTTATNIIKRGGSDSEAGEYLGHKPITTTGKYYTYKSNDYKQTIFKNYIQTV